MSPEYMNSNSLRQDMTVTAPFISLRVDTSLTLRGDNRHVIGTKRAWGIKFYDASQQQRVQMLQLLPLLVKLLLLLILLVLRIFQQSAELRTSSAA